MGPESSNLGFPVFLAACVCLAFLATRYFSWASRERRRFQLRAGKLARRVCPACGYNITGNVSGTCPECGEACTLARQPHAISTINHAGNSLRTRGSWAEAAGELIEKLDELHETQLDIPGVGVLLVSHPTWNNGQFTTQTLRWPAGGDLSRPGINKSYYHGGDIHCLIRTATRDEWTRFAHNFPAIMAALAKREEERKASGWDVLSLPR